MSTTGSISNVTTSMGTIISTVKVTPEQLFTKADEVSKKTTAAEKAYSDLKSTVERTQSYWLGEAGELHRKLFSDKQVEIEEIISGFREHANDLQQIANNYIQTEKEVHAIIIESLPEDVIF